MARVVFEKVSKLFGQVVAVDDLSLEVRDQEFLVLLGPSGCGKSTILRLVAGLEEPTAGTIAIGERVVNDIDPKLRDIAMVFQSYALYPHMSVRENIEFPLRKRKIAKAERHELVNEAAEMLELTEVMGRKPAQLSGGQRQRVALGRAIVRRPAAFLMDEPLSNLDAKLRVQTRAELVELQQRLATTTIYVTHDQVEAMTMGSRIAIINYGALQQVGPPQEVYEQPANVFVAQFIGSPPMNIVTGTVVREGETLAATGPGVSITLPSRLAQAVNDNSLEQVIVGIRPEHIHIDDGPVKARVKSVESLGHERHVICDLADGQPIVVRLPAEETPPTVASTARLTTRAEHLHLFDPATKQRIG